MTDTSWLGPAIDVRPLPTEHQAAFIDLLRGLGAHEWDRATVCPGWSVKDVAAHVLGDQVGRLSIHRDGFHVLRPRDGEVFSAFLDRINDEWVTDARVISPPMLVEMLSTVGDGRPADRVDHLVATGAYGARQALTGDGRQRLLITPQAMRAPESPVLRLSASGPVRPPASP
jgi:hypothetical protein